MSSASALFEFAREIVRDHEAFMADGRIRVVRVIVSDLHEARPVLEALCALMNGVLMDATVAEGDDGSLHEPVPATSDAVRRAAVEAALVTDAGRRVRLRDSGNDLIDAVIEEPSAGSNPSPGLRTVTAAARAVLHRDLDRYEFAAIAYTSAGIDYQFQHALWRLWADQLPQMPSAALRTLLVVIEGTIDVGAHCQTETGFRFAVDDGRLLRRNDRDALRASAASIAQHSDPLVLFLGAGFAVSSRLPHGDALRDGAIRRLLNVAEDESPTSDDLCVRFYRWLAGANKLSVREQEMHEREFVRGLTLERVVRAEHEERNALPTLDDFRALHDEVIDHPGAAVRHLATLLQKDSKRVIIVELNFDLLIERHAGVPLRVFSSEEEFKQAAAYIQAFLAGTESDVPVLKLHGTISSPETCVVNEEQTELGVGNGKLAALNALVGTVDRPRLWVYVGASLRDRDLVPVLQREEYARGLDERWVNPYLVGTLEEFARSRVNTWRNRPHHQRIEDRLVTEMADPFFGALAEAWGPN